MKILPPDAALRLAAIVESSDDAIVSKDLNGIITSWNAGAEQLFGYTADEAVGRSITMLIPPDRLSEEDLVLSRIRRGLRVEPFDTIRWRKDGTLVDVSVTVSPIRDANGTIIGASKIAREHLGSETDRSRAAGICSTGCMGLARRLGVDPRFAGRRRGAVGDHRSGARGRLRPTAMRCGAATAAACGRSSRSFGISRGVLRADHRSPAQRLPAAPRAVFRTAHRRRRRHDAAWSRICATPTREKASRR